MPDIPDMSYRALGRTGLRVSRVGLGTGGPSRAGKAHGGSDSKVERLVRTAVDLGVNVIDTARAYGTERALGKALKSVTEEVYIATKVRCYEGPDTFDAEQRPIVDPGHVVTSVEESLRDLQRDVIDVLQLHAVTAPGLASVIEHLVPAVTRLQEEGKVRFLGVTEHPGLDPGQDMIAHACDSGVFDTVMFQYGIFDQVAARRSFALTTRYDIGVFGMCAARAAFTDAQTLGHMLELIAPDEQQSLEFLLQGDVGSYADAAYRFAVARDEIHCVLIGTGRADHLIESTAAILGAPLPTAHVQELEERYGDLDGSILWPDYNAPR